MKGACESANSPGSCHHAWRSAMDPQDSTEIWKPVPSYEDRYEVSSLGRVRSLYHRWGRRKQARILIGSVQDGRRSHALGDGSGHPKKRWCVARLVLLAFVGSPKAGQVSRHWNGDSSNDRLENLRWGTQKENYADAVRHGTAPRGVRHGQSKLTPEKVKEARVLREEGWSWGKLGKYFSVWPMTIKAAVTGETWKHV